MALVSPLPAVSLPLFPDGSLVAYPGDTSGVGVKDGTTTTSPSRSSYYSPAGVKLFNWHDFEVLHQVGEGSTASVLKARYRPSLGSGDQEAIYALKVCRSLPEAGMSISTLQELKALQFLKGTKHTIQLIGCAFSPMNELVLVEEYMESDLIGLITSEEKEKMTQSHIKCILQQLLAGIEECHQRNIIHRDMKTANVLLHRGHLRITDFGFATTLEAASRYKSNELVTIWYRPPEIILGKRDYGTEIDMWSVGCIFVELLVGRPAFPCRSPTAKKQLELIFQTLGTPNETFGIPTYTDVLREKLHGVNPNAVDLISSLLSLDPKKRPTAAQALAHPYFTRGVPPCAPSELPSLPEAHEFEQRLKSMMKRKPDSPSSSDRPHAFKKPSSQAVASPRKSMTRERSTKPAADRKWTRVGGRLVSCDDEESGEQASDLDSQVDKLKRDLKKVQIDS